MLDPLSDKKGFLKNHKKRWTCTFCDKSFKRNTLRRKHIKLVHEGQLFSWMNKHEGWRVQCHLCEKWFKSIRNLRKHFNFHHESGKQWNTCDECNYDGSNVEYHKIKYHTLTYPCIACNFVGKSKEEIKLHKKKHEEDCHDQPSPECGVQKIENSQNIDTISTQGEHNDQNKIIFHESSINKIRVELSHDQLDEFIHQNILHDNSKWLCTICNMSSSFRSNVARHIEGKHVSSFVCAVCSKPARTKESLRKHMATYHGGQQASSNPLDESEDNDQIDDQKDVSIRESQMVSRGEYLEFDKEGFKQTKELDKSQTQSQCTLGRSQDEDQNKDLNDIVIHESQMDKAENQELVKEQLTKVKREIEDQIANKLPVSKTQLRCMTDLINQYQKIKMNKR